MKLRMIIAGLLLVVSYPAMAQEEPCGLCDEEVTMNAQLAQCFLAQYRDLEQRTSAAVAVDLSACPQVKDRGVVAALPTAQAAAVEPTLEFMASRKQLSCLKEKLEEPGLVLDPSATIKLDACNGQTSGN